LVRNSSKQQAAKVRLFWTSEFEWLRCVPNKSSPPKGIALSQPYRYLSQLHYFAPRHSLQTTQFNQKRKSGPLGGIYWVCPPNQAKIFHVELEPTDDRRPPITHLLSPSSVIAPLPKPSTSTQHLLAPVTLFHHEILPRSSRPHPVRHRLYTGSHQAPRRSVEYGHSVRFDFQLKSKF
jgi:hypothetical protein